MMLKMNKKYSDDDSDDCGLLKQALQVTISEDFNPNKVPQTGEEYLQHVVYEREKCETWLTVDIDRSKFKSQTFKIEIDTSLKKAPSILVPSIEWQTQKIEQFIIFRKFIHFKVENEPTVSSFNETTFLDKVQREFPQFSDITIYTQSAKIRMLQMISKFLDTIPKGDSIGEKMGAWLYAILTLLEKPLSPDSCYSLREFAKRCLTVRSNLLEDCDENLYVSLNLFICIVARFYNQLDLADP